MHRNLTKRLENPKATQCLSGNNLGDVTMDNQQERPLDAELAWLAGMWEADGSMSLHKNYWRKKKFVQYQPSMQFTNTDLHIIESVISILKKHGLAYYQTVRIQAGVGSKLKCDIRIVGIKRCKRFLEMLIPYMRSAKKKRSEIILEFLKERLSKPKCTRYGEIEHAIYGRYEAYNKIVSKGIPNDYTLDV